MILGNPLDRVEGRDKVTGAARYAAEAPMEAAFGVIVQSSIAKGAVTRFDTAAAAAAPGVLGILTPENMPRLTEGFSGDTRAPLADDEIIYAGQHLAVVVAATLEQAQFAASLLEVKANSQTPAFEIDSAPQANKTSDGDEPPKAQWGDVDAALSGPGLVVVSETYRTPPENHNPIEMSATTAAWDGDCLTVWDSTQGVTRSRDALAKAFGLDPKSVRLFCPHTGGGFGCKGEQWHHKFLAAAAARLVGRPVRLMLTRSQMFTSCGHRPETVQDITLAASSDGKLTAIRHHSSLQSSPTNTHIESCGMGTSRVLYTTPNADTTHALKVVDLPPPTWMRAPGEAPGSFALECAMDELADRLAMDPVELRHVNYAERHPETGKPWSTKNLRECYKVGAERFGWERRATLPKGTGFGMATAAYPAHAWGCTARIRLLLADGAVCAIGESASQDLGTGTWTIGRQIVAELCGLPIEQVSFNIGDSDLPKSSLSGGSATAANLARALSDAARRLKKAIGKRLGSTDVQLAGERITIDGRSISLREILRDGPIEAMGGEPSDDESGEGEEEQDAYAFHSFGVHFVEVQIHDPVPLVRVKRVVSVMDIGRVLNEKTARSQVIGGVVMGIGMALMEHTHYDPRTGRVVNDNLGDYLVCTNADVPPIEVQFIGEPDLKFNPLGCRGVGEIGITGVAAAIANAVFHATGRRIRELPITPDRLLDARRPS